MALSLGDSSTSGLQYDEAWRVAGDSIVTGNRRIYSYDFDTDAGVRIRQHYPAPFTGAQLARLGDQAATFADTLHLEPLGPILNSEVSYVGPKPYIRRGTLDSTTDEVSNDYADYLKSREEIRPVVFVGSFDNMLHSFDAATGEELFAYVPGELIRDTMFDQQYQNSGFGVDGNHHVAHVYLADRGGWRTLLLGGLRRGGKSIFALDVTDPFNFKKSDILWEMNAENLPGLGYTFSSPSVGTFENGKSYAVISNGYNNTVGEPATVDTSGRAYLYVVDIHTGALIRRFESRFGHEQDPLLLNRPNGFAEASLVDSDDNGLVDTVYVGDFFGEVYGFNVQDEDPSSWRSWGGDVHGVSHPLMRGEDVAFASVTTRPVVTKTQIEVEGEMRVVNQVMVATGQDITREVPKRPEYIVGFVHDQLSEGQQVRLDGMVEHRISLSGLNLVYDGASTDDVMSDLDVSLNDQGWFIRLDQGLDAFSVVRNMKIISGELHVLLDPKIVGVETECELAERRQYALVLSPRTGGLTKRPIFLGNDGQRRLDNGKTVVGELLAVRQANTQIGLADNGKTYAVTIEEGRVRLVERGAINPGDGRQSWRRLY